MKRKSFRKERWKPTWFLSVLVPGPLLSRGKTRHSVTRSKGLELPMVNTPSANAATRKTRQLSRAHCCLRHSLDHSPPNGTQLHLCLQASISCCEGTRWQSVTWNSYFSSIFHSAAIRQMPLERAPSH